MGMLFPWQGEQLTHPIIPLIVSYLVNTADKPAIGFQSSSHLPNFCRSQIMSWPS
jgi:hypothetical protein